MGKVIGAIVIVAVAWFAATRFFGGSAEPGTSGDLIGESTVARLSASIASAIPEVGDQEVARTRGEASTDELLDEEPGGGSDEIAPIVLSTAADPEASARDRRGRAADTIREALEAASEAARAGDELAALRAYSRAYTATEDLEGRQKLRKEIDPRVSELYFSKLHVPEISTTVRVEAGDTLLGIAGRLAKERSLIIAPGLIMLPNGIEDARRIRAGQTLKILTEPMRIEVSKSMHLLDVYLGDVPVLSYRVGLGKNDSTPEGTFRIVTRQVEPIWFHDGQRIPYGDERNVLGTRWLGFENSGAFSGYGIHGTWEPESIGQNASEGCVRMRNADVEALFELVPRGIYTTVRP